MITAADVVCGLAWGDEAKGKITAWQAANIIDTDEFSRSGNSDRGLSTCAGY